MLRRIEIANCSILVIVMMQEVMIITRVHDWDERNQKRGEYMKTYKAEVISKSVLFMYILLLSF